MLFEDDFDRDLLELACQGTVCQRERCAHKRFHGELVVRQCRVQDKVDRSSAFRSVEVVNEARVLRDVDSIQGGRVPTWMARHVERKSEDVSMPRVRSLNRTHGQAFTILRCLPEG